MANKKSASDRRGGGFNHDSIGKALIVGGFTLHRATVRATIYMNMQTKQQVTVGAVNPLKHWSTIKWQKFLRDNKLRVTDIGGREALVSNG